MPAACIHPLSFSHFTLQVATEQSVAFFGPSTAPAAQHRTSHPKTAAFLILEVAAQAAAPQATRDPPIPAAHTNHPASRLCMDRDSTTPFRPLSSKEQVGCQCNKARTPLGMRALRLLESNRISASPMPAPCPDGPAAPTRARPGCGSAHRCAECAA